MQGKVLFLVRKVRNTTSGNYLPTATISLTYLYLRHLVDFRGRLVVGTRLMPRPPGFNSHK